MNLQDCFWELLRSGLWEHGISITAFDPIDFAALYDLAESQAVVGLIAAGLEHVEDRKVMKVEALPFMKKVFSMEGRNAGMNQFIAGLIAKMREAGISALLVKGQGIAQCYSRPQWRSAGDVDLFLEEPNYTEAKRLLKPLASSIEIESGYTKHLCLTIDSWTVELHGTLRTELSSSIDKCIDEVQDDTFAQGNVRTWHNGDTDVFLPGANNDVIFVYTHFFKHFYNGGIGLRQLCDWCRLLWTYRESIDRALLEQRLRKMGLVSEWKAFAALAVDYLGMPADAMPLFDASPRWRRKARRICAFIMKVGNFGYNRDQSYYRKYPFLIRKSISLGRRLGDLVRHAAIFPLDSFRFLPGILFHGFEAAVKER